MRRVWLVVGIMVGAIVCGSPVVLAESRPIEQLPQDVVRWSTLWTAIPRQMYEVGQEEGPLAALTLGPAKGVATFVASTTEEAWNVMKPDEKPGQPSTRGNPAGLIFRYKF